MFQLHKYGYRNTVLLATAAAISLVLAGCGEQTAPASKQEEMKLLPGNEFAVNLKKAEAGDAAAQNSVAVNYADGVGVSKDATKAIEWWQKSAAQGYAMAQRNLAFAYFHGEGLPKDMAKAIELYEKAAAQGDSRAQAMLGGAYREGKGVPKDLVKSIELFEKAAAQGDRGALVVLGLNYHHGRGVPRDMTKAIELYEKAAAQGDALAQLTLGEIFHAGDGVPKDLVKAKEWYEKAAIQGNTEAQFNLGILYHTGEGAPRDATKAAEWWQKAAMQGKPNAMANIGWAYSAGEGVSRDIVLAYAWANLAASQGNKVGIENRELNEPQLSPDEKAEAQRISSNWKKGQLLVRENPSTNSSTMAANTNSNLTKIGTGTAFIVGKSGEAITNHHVIAGCKEIRAEGREGFVKVTTSDAVNDLALIQLPGAVNATASIPSDPAKLRQGEDIIAFGFPLNAVLSSGGNLTPGVVSALTGIGNNTNQIQITAPIQPGSSGSPVLNKKGEVVGVVSMKLSDTKMVKATGSVGQNVNFAVSGQTLKSFLDTHKVDYRKGGFMFFEKSTADLADEARKWTAVVECWK